MLGRTFLGGYRFTRRGWSKSFSLLAAGAFRSFGPNSVIELPARIAGEDRIAIGSGVFVGAGSWLQVLDETHPSGDVVIEIGDGTSIAGSCVLSATSSIRIGRRVLFARNVYVADHLHAFADGERAVLDQGIDRVGAVEICETGPGSAKTSTSVRASGSGSGP